MTLGKFIYLSFILLNIHGSFSCGPKMAHKTDIGIGRIIFENISDKVSDNDSIYKTTEHLDFFTLLESPESCWFMNEQNLPKCLQKPVMIVRPGSMVRVPKYSLTKWFMEYIQ
jgi:hypothetical protein